MTPGMLATTTLTAKLGNLFDSSARGMGCSSRRLLMVIGNSKMPYFAHSLKGQPSTAWETMAEHEQRVAVKCAEFLKRIHPDLEAWGELLGRWHDLGKYHPEFQAKIRGTRTQIEHAGAGARLAVVKSPHAGLASAFAIAGHHAGLANLENNAIEFGPVKRSPISQRLESNEKLLVEIESLLPESLKTILIPNLPTWIKREKSPENVRRTFSFFTRILFSALVDADRLATEYFYATAEGRVPSKKRLDYDSLETLRERIDEYIDAVSVNAGKNPTPVNKFRFQVLGACRNAANHPPGLFSLTVPTGGGKTLSAMSFALNHAIQHGLDRVIVVIPYTSIIRQNANNYRIALGTDGRSDRFNVVEHHSGIDEQKACYESRESKEAEIRRRIAVENWDAPVIVTTSVQFFESLFTDHPSQARKLHRIAKSVVILDEVQTLPPHLLHPILDGLRELSRNYGTTVVLSTATPPALLQRDGLANGLKDVRPIIENPQQIAASPAARRVRVDWRIQDILTFEGLATELANISEPQSLTVVHKRKDAQQLAQQLPKEKRIHLSAQMCPAHRIQVIDEINRRLNNDEDCIVVATQLIEAGVDIDLPVVYRALAGVDSLAQAAGRCDREGKRTMAAGQPAGKLVVFLSETSPPGDTLQKAMSTTQALFLQKRTEGVELDIFNPTHCTEYFERFYGLNALDSKNIQRERAALNFANVGRAFQMIENNWSFPVVVPWPMSGPACGEGMRRAEDFRENPCRDTNRALQPYIVQIPKAAANAMANEGVIEFWEDSIGLPFATFDSNWYDKEFGIVMPNEKYTNPEKLIE